MASEQPAGYVCDGCGHLARDPEQDMQKLREGNFLSCCPERKMLPVYTRPTPVAPVSPDATGKCGELVTVAWQYQNNGWWHAANPDKIQEFGFQTRELVTRSQAEELLARKDYLLSVSDTVAQQLQNQIVTLTLQKEDLEAQLERFRSDRAYTVGFTDGHDAAEAKLAAAEKALTEIASFTQTTDLLWWQERARAALGGKPS
nr:hypothetical protein [Brucella intermedia]